jgi:hypothetical protein
MKENVISEKSENGPTIGKKEAGLGQQFWLLNSGAKRSHDLRTAIITAAKKRADHWHEPINGDAEDCHYP